MLFDLHICFFVHFLIDVFSFYFHILLFGLTFPFSTKTGVCIKIGIYIYVIYTYTYFSDPFEFESI